MATVRSTRLAADLLPIGARTVQQLSGLDASFLYLETPNAPMHVGGFAIYDPSDRSRRQTLASGESCATSSSRLHLARAFRQKAGQRAVQPRSPLLGRGRELRPRVSRPAHRAAAAGRLAPALHPGGAPPFARARPQPAAVGALRDRGARRRRGPAERKLRDPLQDPPRRDRRRDRRGDHRRAARPRARAGRVRRRRGAVEARARSRPVGAARASDLDNATASPSASALALRTMPAFASYSDARGGCARSGCTERPGAAHALQRHGHPAPRRRGPLLRSRRDPRASRAPSRARR